MHERRADARACGLRSSSSIVTSHFVATNARNMINLRGSRSCAGKSPQHSPYRASLLFVAGNATGGAVRANDDELVPSGKGWGERPAPDPGREGRRGREAKASRRAAARPGRGPRDQLSPAAPVMLGTTERLLHLVWQLGRQLARRRSCTDLAQQHRWISRTSISTRPITTAQQHIMSCGHRSQYT